MKTFYDLINKYELKAKSAEQFAWNLRQCRDRWEREAKAQAYREVIKDIKELL